VETRRPARIALDTAALLVIVLGAGAAARAQPNDPLFGPPGQDGQWNLRGSPDPDNPSAGVRGIDAEGAWTLTAGRREVLIAVLDSGVRLDHPDLAANIALNLGEGMAAGLVDADGDGALTVAEAAATVVDLDGDGMVTALDVLAHASNGVDDDGNGYIDDLAGWDFEDDDADPTDNFGHGTGRAGIAAAVMDNALGMVGVCPRCSILPVRMGRTFVAVPDKLAAAVGYAADRGAAATVMATGSLGNSRAERAAVAYADARGVVQCAAIGNERSRHHHLPQVYDEVIAVAGIKPDDPEAPASYSTTWKGSNFGAHASVAAPTFVWATQLDGTFSVEGGTSSSVPHCAAVAGLLAARAKDLGVSPTPRQFRELMEITAGDAPAFSAKRGHGRLDAAAAVAALAGALPPDARIVSPRFYELVPPGALEVEIDAPEGATVELDFGYGVEPASFSAALGTTIEPVPPEAGDRIEDELGDAHAVTVRLTVSDGEAVTVDRRTFFVHRDPDAVPGFPVRVGASAEGGPLLADLDGKPGMEIALATSDGDVLVFDGGGASLAGWPAKLDDSPIVHAAAQAHARGAIPTCCAPVFAPLAAGDLDGDGRVELVATGLDGKLYAWDASGARRGGFPRALGAPAWAAPVLVDLDRDGTLEIVAATYDRAVHVIDAAGEPRAPWPVIVGDESATSAYPGLVVTPAVGDLEGDGSLELVVATSESEGEQGAASGRVYALRTDGSVMPGFPVKPFGLLPETFPVVGGGVAASPVLADLDGDGRKEILAGHAAGQIAAFDVTGQLVAPFDHGFLLALLSPHGPSTGDTDPRYQMNALLLAQPVVADLDGDGRPEVMSGTMGLPEIDLATLAADPGEALASLLSLLTVWTADGKVLQPFPVRLEGWTLFASSTVVDVDGDGRPEMLAGSDGGWLHALRVDGTEAAGYPRFVGGWLTAASAGDLDGDGQLEVVATTREGMLFAWRAGPACVGGRNAARWVGAHHDVRNTGDLGADVALPGAAPCSTSRHDDLLPSGGCACEVTRRTASTSTLLFAALAALAAMTRRRRSGCAARRAAVAGLGRAW
jgi:hypothetical protein